MKVFYCVWTGKLDLGRGIMPFLFFFPSSWTAVGTGGGLGKRRPHCSERYAVFPSQGLLLRWGFYSPANDCMSKLKGLEFFPECSTLNLLHLRADQCMNLNMNIMISMTSCGILVRVTHDGA
jgi:hypothetical protein